MCVGFGEACRVAVYEMENDKKHIEKLYNKLYDRLNAEIPEIYLNGDEVNIKKNLNYINWFYINNNFFISFPDTMET